MKIASSFGIPENVMFAPAANDYEAFNARSNFGEVYHKGEGLIVKMKAKLWSSFKINNFYLISFIILF